jgi:hypothetical protein
LSHTLEYGQFALHHDGDFQGDVVITDDKGDSMKVPAKLIRRFVAAQVRADKISNLEQMSDDQVLGLERLPI